MWIVDLCSLLMMFTHLNYEGIKNPPEIGRASCRERVLMPV